MNLITSSDRSFWKSLQALAELFARGLGVFRGFLSRRLTLSLAACAALVVVLMAWSCERQARLRQALEAQRVKEQAASDIAKLEAHASAALREANQQRAQAVRELEARRQKLAREAEGLRERLGSLRSQELARLGEVATLPTAQVVTRVATRLGQPSLAPSDQTPSSRPAELKSQEAPASAHVPGLEGEEAARKMAAPATDVHSPQSAAASPPKPEPRTSNPALGLSDRGVREVDSAFIQLDACREQRQVLEQQAANCSNQMGLTSSVITQQKVAIEKLNVALADQDQIMARREAEHRAELKLARGTWRSRFLRALKYFAAGVVVGVVVR